MNLVPSQLRVAGRVLEEVGHPILWKVCSFPLYSVRIESLVLNWIIKEATHL